MENTTDKEQNRDVDIAPDGDLILVVGPEQTKLRVSSALLMAASKPFSVMLGKNWKEGHDMRSRDEPYHLSMPEDDAAALRVICCIIHYQNDKIPQTFPAIEVLEVAIAADKYDMVNAMKFASDTWLRVPGKDTEILITLAAAAYLLENAQAFRNITKALVINCLGPYTALENHEVQAVLPWRLLYMLEEKRGMARLHLANILIAGGGANVFAGKRVPLAEEHFPLYSQNLTCDGERDARSSSSGPKDPMPYVPVSYGPTIQTATDL
ncbi:hypothetical protein NW768_007544 [Fusarium equiseti]|uniref:BTB domain-containing protein n=1 Tax=Fusarium equiseti TaxID=61235 RepID=A0ABQ8R7T8_FUSEQ|nr:hypothetical protein NW768_007544 [Fusarium equiseti]